MSRLRIVLAVLLALALAAAPLSARAQQTPPRQPPGPTAVPAPGKIDVQIPQIALDSAAQADLVELVYHMVRAQGADLIGHVEAVDEVLTPLLDQVKQLLGPEKPLPATIPDVAAMRKEMDSIFAAMRQSKTVAEAQQQTQRLVQLGERAQKTAFSAATDFDPIKKLFDGKGSEIQKKVSEAVQQKVKELQEQAVKRLEALVSRRVAEEKARLQAEVDAYVRSLVAAAGRTPNIAAITAQVEAFVSTRVTALQARLEAEFDAESKKMEAEITGGLDEFFKTGFGADVDKLQGVADLFLDVDQRIEELAQAKIARIAPEEQQAAERVQARIVEQMVNKETAKAEALIRSKAGDIEKAKAAGRQAPNVDELLKSLNDDKLAFVKQLASAKTDADYAQAIDALQARWEALGKDLDKLRYQNAQEILDRIRAELTARDAENKVRQALATTQSGIATLDQAARQRPLSADQEETLLKLRALLSQLQEGLALLDQVKQAKSTDPIDQLLELQGRLQQKLGSIERAAKEKSLQKGQGIFIEAENESSRSLLPKTEEWHSREELNNPSWRPPLSGGGLWYLSRGGESLSYAFQVVAAGEYTIWVRDYDDNRHPLGARMVTLAMDGRDLGNYDSIDVAAPGPKGELGWHATAKVRLEPGAHTMKVTKVATTSSAALLDAFYLTSDPNDRPDAGAGTTTASIFIEAENETSTRIKSTGSAYDSREERNPSRPKTFGGADWVLSNGGDTLVYRFQVAQAGEYYVWVRDYSDNKHPAGARAVEITFDGRSLAVVLEKKVRAAYPPGVFAWQRAGRVTLSQGEHVLEVKKTETTSAGALLDAYYLTTDANDDPSKKPVV